MKRVLAVSAVGSLQEHLHPGDLVTPDQLIDRTRGTRVSTFFGAGAVAHVAFADPFCGDLRARAQEAATDVGAQAHAGGTYVVIEGPAFGTRAESELYRSWGASLVGMTALPEAKLAREAELCYAMLAAVTDYDAWHAEEAAVDATTVMETLAANVEVSRQTVARLAAGLGEDGASGCDCGVALDAGLVTAPEAIPAEVREQLEPILRRRLGTADG